MKIETPQTNQVRPIIITLENVDELIFMWHRMVTSTSVIEENSENKETFNPIVDDSLAYNIFSKVDDELAFAKIKPGVIVLN